MNLLCLTCQLNWVPTRAVEPCPACAVATALAHAEGRVKALRERIQNAQELLDLLVGGSEGADLVLARALADDDAAAKEGK